MSETVAVEARALRAVLEALVGPPHHIRELQATRNFPGATEKNPIDVLLDTFNAYCAAAPSDGDPQAELERRTSHVIVTPGGQALACSEAVHEAWTKLAQREHALLDLLQKVVDRAVGLDPFTEKAVREVLPQAAATPTKPRF